MKVKALYLGQRIAVKSLIKQKWVKLLGRDPYVMQFNGTGKNFTAFRYGVVVLWDFDQAEEEALLKKINRYLEGIDESEEPKSELMEIVEDAQQEEDVLNGVVTVPKITEKFLKLLSVMLARSLVLEDFEMQVEYYLKDFSGVLDHFAKTGKIQLSAKNLLRLVGRAMHARNATITQMTMLDKPDFTWDDPDLDEWYTLLDEEYEIGSRYGVLVKKLEAIFGDVDFILNYLEGRRSFYLELTIVFLIIFEVLQGIFTGFWH